MAKRKQTRGEAEERTKKAAPEPTPTREVEEATTPKAAEKPEESWEADLRVRFQVLQEKKAKLDRVVAPLREKRDALAAKIAPVEDEMRKLAAQIKSHMPEMGRIDREMGAVARALGGRSMSDNRS